MKELPIEDDVPIPPKFLSPRTPAGRAALKLKCGQSVLCPTDAERYNALQAIKRSGGKYQSRKVEGGWRVWRVE